MKSYIKSKLSETRLNQFKDILISYGALKHRFITNFSRVFLISKKTSVLYYFFTGEFDRECYASLKGVVDFELKKFDNYSLYRRNVHRLEKALIMRPRREVFATDYIGELVNLHVSLISKINEEQAMWGDNVLRTYFEAVPSGRSRKVDMARNIYNTSKMDVSIIAKVPRAKQDTVKNEISFDSYYKLVESRSSTRWFIEKEVPKEVVKNAVNAASQAPSACNRQPYQYYFSQDSARSRNIASLAMGSAGFCSNIQSLICVVGDLSYFNRAYDRHVIYVDSSLATMQLLLGLETQGVSSCVLNWPDVKVRDEKISKELGLSSSQKVICLIAIGYPDETGGIPFSQKKSHQELLVEL